MKQRTHTISMRSLLCLGVIWAVTLTAFMPGCDEVPPPSGEGDTDVGAALDAQRVDGAVPDASPGDVVDATDTLEWELPPLSDVDAMDVGDMSGDTELPGDAADVEVELPPPPPPPLPDAPPWAKAGAHGFATFPFGGNARSKRRGASAGQRTRQRNARGRRSRGRKPWGRISRRR